MNESNFIPSESSEVVAALRRQVNLLLLALIVVSGTLTVYLWYQSHVTGAEIAAIEPQARQVVQTFEKNQPALEKFVNALGAYGKAHPDFEAQVLRKYGITQQSVAPAAAPKK